MSCDEDDNTTGCLIRKALPQRQTVSISDKVSDEKTIRTSLTTISAYDRTGEPDGGVLHKETIGITENFK